MRSKWAIIKLSFILLLGSACNQSDPVAAKTGPDIMMVRIAALEIEPEYLDEYLDILEEESEASVRLEPGVICIYPMYQKEKPNQIRLLEIYASKEAYETHLQMPHFMHYKEATLHMVRSLELIDMEAIDPELMPEIFKKLQD